MKLATQAHDVPVVWVAPHAGAWIETLVFVVPPPVEVGRPPRGGVD